MPTRLEGYLLIPHELLHIVGYKLIYDKKPQDRTPLDFLFWPILTDNPKRVQASALIVMTFVLCLYAIYLLFF